MADLTAERLAEIRDRLGLFSDLDHRDGAALLAEVDRLTAVLAEAERLADLRELVERRLAEPIPEAAPPLRVTPERLAEIRQLYADMRRYEPISSRVYTMDVGPLLAEVDRLTAECSRWQAIHDGLIAKLGEQAAEAERLVTVGAELRAEGARLAQQLDELAIRCTCDDACPFHDLAEGAVSTDG